MSGQYGNRHPVQGNEDILISSVNEVWGQDGAGSPMFWEKLGPYVFRDSVTAGEMESSNGYYDLVSVGGLRYTRKGRTEKRSFEEIGGTILVGPARDERIDGPSVKLDVHRSGARTAKIRRAIDSLFRVWADHLPMEMIIGLMVNGRISPNHPTPSGTDYIYTKGSAFFATNHRVNPMDEANTITQANLVSLGGTWNTTRWATAKDAMLAWKDMNGKSLPNANTARKPLMMVGTTTQAIRLAQMFGPVGSSTERLLIESASGNAGVDSVVVGEVEIMVNPYLISLAESANLATVQGRTYCFTGGLRAPFIFREARAPMVQTTGPDSYLRHEQNAEGVYIDAEADAIWGEPGSLWAFDES